MNSQITTKISPREEGYKFDRAELGAALNKMDNYGAFSDIELNDGALASLMGMGGEQQQGAKGKDC